MQTDCVIDLSLAHYGTYRTFMPAPALPPSSPHSPQWPLPPGMRATRATRALAAVYEARPDAALSEPEVEAALAAAGVAVNKVTVYRNARCS